MSRWSTTHRPWCSLRCIAAIHIDRALPGSAIVDCEPSKRYFKIPELLCEDDVAAHDLAEAKKLKEKAVAEIEKKQRKVKRTKAKIAASEKKENKSCCYQRQTDNINSKKISSTNKTNRSTATKIGRPIETCETNY